MAPAFLLSGGTLAVKFERFERGGPNMAGTTGHHEHSGTWTASLAFWLALLLAVAAYGVVALAPNLLTYLQLRNEHDATQLRLVSLEHEVSDLRLTVDSLERDPEFVRKLAKTEFAASRAGEEHIPVDEELQLSVRDNDPVFEMPASSLPWYGGMVEAFATNRRLRGGTLLVSSMVVILAFCGFGGSEFDRSR